MLMLVFMRIAGDLGLYFSFAGFFGCIFGAEGGFFLICIALMSLAFTLSYALKNAGWVRFLPLVLIALCAFLPGGNLSGFITAAPALLFLVFLAARKIYEPDRSRQVEVFSVFWKVFIAFCLVLSLMGSYKHVCAVSLPAGIITLACSVLIMRSMRHEPEIYLQKKYQLSNVLTILAVGVFVLLISSEAFVSFCLLVLKTIYQLVIVPLMFLMVYVFAGVLMLISKLLKFIKPPEREGQQVELDIWGTEELFDNHSPDSDVGEILTRILVAIGIIAALVIIFFVFRALSRKSRGDMTDSGMTDTRTFAGERKQRREDIPDGGNVGRVRHQYRKFLRLIFERGIDPGKSDTSLDIDRQYRMLSDGRAAGELRKIYIAARYNGKASKSDAQKAKELYSEIKKNNN